MIAIDKLKAVELIVVHDNCADGTASAMILHDILPNVPILRVQYSTEAHKALKAQPGMLFCDFSPHPSRTQEFLDMGAIVLDHHGGTAKTVTLAFEEAGLGAFADEKANPGVCGAVLAYHEVWLPLMRQEIKEAQLLEEDCEWPAPQGVANLSDHRRRECMETFAGISGVRDTWKTQDPRWGTACEHAEALRFWPWEKILSTPWDRWDSELFAIGPVLIERNRKSVQRCIESSYQFTTANGRRVMVFEGTKPTSDAAEAVKDSVDLVVGLSFLLDEGVPKLIMSTRSRGDFNCQNLAIAHGGGGHVNAAGFNVKLKDSDPQPYELVRRVLDRYEAVEKLWTEITSYASFHEKAKEGLLVPQEVYEALATKESPKFWDLRLNEYQRDNLTWLIAAVGFPFNAQGVNCHEEYPDLKVFGSANTGDWLGEIGWKLDAHLGVGRPNCSLEDLDSHVHSYVQSVRGPG